MSLTTLAEAKEIMNRRDEKGNAIPFSIRYVAWNAESRTGGQIIDLPMVILYRNRLPRKSKLTKSDKDFNFYENFNLLIFARDELTRKLVSTGNIRKCHIWLIISINNQEVTWT